MKYRPEYNPKIIGSNLKRLRIKKGLSVDEVREYLRLGTLQAIYKYESGNGYPQADTLLALMDLYDADYHDIVDEHKEGNILVRHIEWDIEEAGIRKGKQVERICRYAAFFKKYYAIHLMG